jgi:hypothetical protein
VAKKRHVDGEGHETGQEGKYYKRFEAQKGGKESPKENFTFLSGAERKTLGLQLLKQRQEMEKRKGCQGLGKRRLLHRT